MTTILKKISTFILLFLFFLFMLAMTFFISYRPRENKTARMKRLELCIMSKMKVAEDKYKLEHLELGDRTIWLDWLDPEEYATYELIKNGIALKERFVLFSTDRDHQINHNGGCKLGETNKKY